MYSKGTLTLTATDFTHVTSTDHDQPAHAWRHIMVYGVCYQSVHISKYA
jgi:hypothetical protein